MGKSATPSDHLVTVEWAESLAIGRVVIDSPLSPNSISTAFDFHLKQYFRLCGLARSQTASKVLAQRAHLCLFKSRVAIERAIVTSIENHPSEWESKLKVLTERSIYGASKKQGVSLRMPLSTCTPTKLCAAGCYAHDVLDASPNAVVRGAINGWIAAEHENGDQINRDLILKSLERHTQRAIVLATRELFNLPKGFSRRGYIRFSHVGEIVFFPDFANALANQVLELSAGLIDCVVYTRSKTSALLDPPLWVINFTLDPASLGRRAWAPASARIVFSAFGGELSPIASVNFLEHHRHSHITPTKGQGNICPATHPETIERTCDACRCKTCFEKTNGATL
jgi:hypothetical protein